MLKYFKKYWIFALLAPAFIGGEVYMDLLQPRLMGKIVDEGVLGLHNGGIGDLNIVVTIGLQMIGLVLIGCLCGILSVVFANLCSQNFCNDIRKETFRKIMSLSFEQTDKFSTGSLITRVTNDITQIQQFVNMSMRGLVRTFLLFAGGIGCLVTLDLHFGTVVACALPFIVICATYFLSKANPRFTVLQEKLDRVNNVMQENVSGLRVVKAYVREGYEEERFGQANEELVGTQLNILLLFACMTPIMNIVLNVAVVAVLKVGAIQVEGGNVTPGEVMAAVTYISQILNAVMRMTMAFQTVSRGVASSKRVSEVMNCNPKVADGVYTEKSSVKGKIEFRHVSFSYPQTMHAKVLDDVSLMITPGETLAILGSTGCGKSSLVNLIPRFYDVTEGQILVDDIDVKDYNLGLLRSKIAFGMQKSEIFNMTVEENILWGNPEASDEEVTQAAQTAQAVEFIENQAEGFQTIVAQGGHSLSGGQKQRLAISRAVIKNAEILILDDATSALDLKTEAKLYEALKKNHKEVTKIIIAQRIASVKDADRIVILENGKIAACGTHDQLLSSNEIYQDIYNSQLKMGGDIHG